MISQSTLQETVVWSSLTEGMQNTNGRFQPVVVDLEPWSGQTVRLRFLFDTADGWGCGEGAHVDDVSVGDDCRCDGSRSDSEDGKPAPCQAGADHALATDFRL